jgi:hypothetical protein
MRGESFESSVRRIDTLERYAALSDDSKNGVSRKRWDFSHRLTFQKRAEEVEAIYRRFVR